MREHLFRGKIFASNFWISGYFYKINDLRYLRWGERSHQVIPESVCEFTGKYLKKKQKLFENDIVFDEIEEDEGDRRIYYVCKYVEAWGKYVFLTQGDLYCLEVGDLSNEPELGIDDSEMLHYAGTYFDNPELLENGQQN